MALTRDFKETVQERAINDPEFRIELLRGGIEFMLSGDLETGKALLRDYVNAVYGFQALAKVTGKSPKSLMNMLGPNGNPQANNLFEIISFLTEHEGLQLELSAIRD